MSAERVEEEVLRAQAAFMELRDCEGAWALQVVYRELYWAHWYCFDKPVDDHIMDAMKLLRCIWPDLEEKTERFISSGVVQR